MSAAPQQTAVRLEASASALRAADWLSLAAAPTFAIMALLTGLFGSSAPDMMCMSGHSVSALSGMVPMYLLMSAFHTAPWLRLLLHR
jgi:CBS domain containing-hemolysin-like protein